VCSQGVISSSQALTSDCCADESEFMMPVVVATTWRQLFVLAQELTLGWSDRTASPSGEQRKHRSDVVYSYVSLSDGAVMASFLSGGSDSSYSQNKPLTMRIRVGGVFQRSTEFEGAKGPRIHSRVSSARGACASRRARAGARASHSARMRACGRRRHIRR
jgi:hypothetical protein